MLPISGLCNILLPFFIEFNLLDAFSASSGSFLRESFKCSPRFCLAGDHNEAFRDTCSSGSWCRASNASLSAGCLNRRPLACIPAFIYPYQLYETVICQSCVYCERYEIGLRHFSQRAGGAGNRAVELITLRPGTVAGLCLPSSRPHSVIETLKGPVGWI